MEAPLRLLHPERRGVQRAHYHRRSNVETTFAMVKGKFGDSVRAKTYRGQVNEVLLKCLCNNIYVLIHAMHELGLTPALEPKSTVSELKVSGRSDLWCKAVGLNGLAGPEYHAIISFGLPIEPEDSQYGKSWCRWMVRIQMRIRGLTIMRQSFI